MQYNYDFNLHHQLVNKSQMQGKFGSFNYNNNVHSVSRYEKPNFFPAPHLIWYIASQIPGKGFLIILKKVAWEEGNSCFSTLSLRKSQDLCQAKLML